MGFRMNPVADDIRKLMFKVKKLQGTDIARSFDGLNDRRNLEESIQNAKAGGMISQAALCITYSPIHTAEYYIQLASHLIDAGADEIAIKDMAGIGRPATLGKIVKGIKADYPNTLVQYHAHSGPGFSVASILEVARAGADIIDVGMEPLSWGTAHADLLTVHEMLRDAGFSLPEINQKAYMETRALTQSFIDDFLGYYINPRNRFMNSLLIGPGLPGGMMGSLMADLENNVKSLNKWLSKRGKPEISQEELLLKLFEEVEYVWPKMGYPPLVTPYSQYVKNVALMNVMQMIKGKERWSMVDDNTWDMLMGKSGNLPGKLAPELAELAAQQGREAFTGKPSSLYPDELDTFREEMKREGWDVGEDEEELMELAMHPQQYRAYRSGKAKADFEADLQKRKAEKSATNSPSTPVAIPDGAPKSLTITVNGIPYEVGVSYGEAGENPSPKTNSVKPEAPNNTNGQGRATEVVLAPLEGKFYLTKEAGEKGVQVGDKVSKGDVIGYIEAMKVINAITSDKSGTITDVCLKNGEDVEEDQEIIRLQA